MANINLTSDFRNSSDILSPVDSRIKINKKETDTEIFSDLKLDLTFNELKERPLNAKDSTRDLQKLKNEESVLNAIRNILSTNQGDRLLNPEMNVNLRSYLFDPITEAKAYFLGYTLQNTIPYYEPRVKIEGINIEMNIEDSSYTINLSIRIPSINEEVKLSTILTSQSYSIDE